VNYYNLKKGIKTEITITFKANCIKSNKSAKMFPVRVKDKEKLLLVGDCMSMVRRNFIEQVVLWFG
jgi:hypothetical protein